MNIKLFPKNLDKKGRALRLTLACLLFVYSYAAMSLLALLAACFTLFEALRGWCIFYQLIGKNSCPLDEQDKR